MTVDELFTKIFSFYVPQLVSIADQPAWDIFINVILNIFSSPSYHMPLTDRTNVFHFRY